MNLEKTTSGSTGETIRSFALSVAGWNRCIKSLTKKVRTFFQADSRVYKICLALFSRLDRGRQGHC